MRKHIATLAIILGCTSPALSWGLVEKCENDPSESLKRAVIGIERAFDDDEIYTENYRKVYGIRGTGWFLNKRTLTLVEHVATGAKFTHDWKVVRLFWSNERDTEEKSSVEVRVRIKQYVPTGVPSERLVLLELDQEVNGAAIAKLAGSPLQRNETVVAIGYLNRELRFGNGRFVLPEPTGQPDPDAKPPQRHLSFEVADMQRNLPAGDRYAFDHGSSGTPIFNCAGDVVAVMAAVLTKELSFGGKTIQRTTAWGSANMLAVSPHELHNMKR